MTRKAKLLRAAELVDEVRSTLNMAFGTCECCHHKRYDNFGEYQLHQELTAIHNKLRRHAGEPKFQDEDGAGTVRLGSGVVDRSGQ